MIPKTNVSKIQHVHNLYTTVERIPLNRIYRILKIIKIILPWNELVGRAFWAIFRMNHEQHVWESSPKICTIGVMVPG